MQRIDDVALRFVLEAAVMAPSADNQHRVRFQLGDDVVNVKYATGALPPQGGYKRILALLSLGAVAENLSIAASRFNLEAHIVLEPDGAKPELVMQASFGAERLPENPLWRYIESRHTNRRVRFRGPRLTEGELEMLEAAAGAYSTSQLVWMDARPQRKLALRLVRRAETERFRNRVLHGELFSAIRFDVGWHQSCQEGMPPGALAVEPPLRVFFSMLRHWSFMHALNQLGMHHVLGWRASELPCRLSPHLGLLAVRQVTDQSVFDAGRSFQRLWLSVTSQGRVLQPMPASALFHFAGAVSEGVSPDTQRLLATDWGSALGDAVPLMLFRLGFAKQGTIVALRRPLEDYLEGSERMPAL